MSGDIKLTGNVNGDLAAQRFNIGGLNLNADLQGRALPGNAATVALAADTALDLGQQTLQIDNLNLAAMGIKLSGTIKGNQLLSEPQFNGTLNSNSFNMKELLTRLGQEAPTTADEQVLQSVSLDSQFSATPNSLSLNPLTLKLDETTLQGKVNLPSFTGPAIRYDLTIDKINADRYLPPKQQAGPDVDTPGSATARTAAQGDLPLQPLRQLDIDGTLRIGQLRINQLDISNFILPLKAQQGRISLSPANAQLYGGGYKGNINLDVTGHQPIISLNESLNGIQSGPLLKALIDDDRILGTANAQVQLTMQGTSATAIRQSLNGVASFEFLDGAYKGVNIGRMLRQAEATL